MSIAIAMRGSNLAEVTTTPSWWRRLFLRQRAVTRFAVLGRCGHWHWDATGRLIHGDRLLALLTYGALAIGAVRSQLGRASSGVSPPN